MTFLNIPYVLLPECFLLLMTNVILLVGLFQPKNSPWVYRLSCLALVACLALIVDGMSISPEFLFNGLFIHDELSSFLKLLSVFLTLSIMIYLNQYVENHPIPKLEYYVLILFSLLGVWVVISCYSFLVMYLGMELMSLPLYALVALQRDTPTSGEAALKYFVMGSVASAMMLFGISIIYGFMGTVNFQVIGQFHEWLTVGGGVLFGLIFVIAGIGFKLASAPFHMWAPDVYSGAPVSSTLLLVAVPKIAAFAMLIRVLLQAFPELFVMWQQVILVLALTSIVVGNIFAVVQTEIRRLLAYSAVSHIGYMLLGFVAGTAEGFASALFYLVSYTIMSVGAFGMLVWLNQRDIKIEHIDDLQGLSERAPWVALMWLLVIFSMLGLPPLLGFMAKFLVLKSLFTSGFYISGVVALLMAAVGCYYYIRIIRVMYFESPEHAPQIEFSGNALKLNVSINGLALLILGVMPSMLWYYCEAPFII